jgi:TPR repeat protein
MKSLLRSLCILTFALLSSATLADDFSNGVALYSEENYVAAAAAFQKSADKGNVDAQFNLGLMYLKGQGVAQDEQQARRFFEQAARQGSARAQLNLGRMYAKGLGVVPSYAKALPWYEKAAAQGYSDAQYTLGLLYVTGTGAPLDYRKAYQLFLGAAEQNNASAQYQLGLMYFKGKAVRLDLVEALKWMILADKYPQAVSYRSYIEAQMSPQQIKQAKEMAAGWEPVNAPES